MIGNKIILYPSNWLYNAGVIGFLRVLQECGEKVENFLGEDGGVEIQENIFYTEKLNDKIEVPKCLKYLIKYILKDEDINEWKNKRIQDLQKKLRTESSKKGKIDKINEELENLKLSFMPEFYRSWGKLFGSNKPFQNLVQREEWNKLEFANLISKIPSLIKEKGDSNQVCALCGNYKVINVAGSKLEERLSKLQITHLEDLGASIGEFPNAFWFNQHSTYICFLCSYLILHYRESLTKLSDNSEIFINAPSFKVMWYLNKYAREIVEKQKVKEVKEILGISLIEMSRRLYVQLGIWTTMNIEVVSKYKVKRDNKWEDKIEFFSLPYEIVRLVSDNEIASTLNEIGEFKILNMVLDGRFDKVLEMGERIFRISILPEEEFEKMNKNRKNDSRAKFIDENIYLLWNKEKNEKLNKKALISFSQKLFKLYALINQKIKREVSYGF